MSVLIAFIVVWALSPGPVAIMTLHKSKNHGTWSGVAVACGATVTSAIMVILAVLVNALGVQQMTSASEFMLLEQAGALCIILIGLYSGYRSLGFTQKDSDDDTTDTSHASGFVQGMMMMATYIPQAVIFYTVIVPQSVTTDNILPVIIGLGTLKVVLILVWHSMIAVLATSAKTWLDNRVVGKGLDLASAGLLITLGINIII